MPRHSFISLLAARGINQRVINELAGHTTEPMAQHYRHLIPDVKEAAIKKVLGANRQRIVYYKKSFIRHRIVNEDVSENRQQLHDQVSVSRSVTCRASASNAPVQVGCRLSAPGIYHAPQVQTPMPLAHPKRLAQDAHRPGDTHPPDERYAPRRHRQPSSRHHEACRQLLHREARRCSAGVWPPSRGCTCCVFTASCSRASSRRRSPGRRNRFCNGGSSNQPLKFSTPPLNCGSPAG